MRVLFVSVALLASLALAYPGRGQRRNVWPGPLDSRRIVCPVLAALVNEGDLLPDADGDVTRKQIYAALHDVLWDQGANADFQARGIAIYTEEDKLTMTTRSRCVPPLDCKPRYLNLYKMNGRMMAEHGISTGTRGGATNVPEFDFTGGPCNGEYPCEERWNKFYAPCADANGNFFIENIHCVICKAWSMGDRSGEFAYNPTQKGQQWQMIAAMTGWLNAFGRVNPGEEHGPTTTHFTTEDARRMIMDGRYPKNYVKRNWGAMSDFPAASGLQLPCADEKGYNPDWWVGTSCEVITGDTCSPVRKCGGGASCLTGYWTGKCVCPRGANGVGTCWDAAKSECVERENKCTYFGEPCQVHEANNPDAPW